ncbi:hypothetical protein WICMUC_004704 [Wickerhamomyces mucosus]|uniref:RNA polymerase-associated protein CTR9 n=1 Tax=Wickerhamomyces mucosus TaxID=1378264 RepID=A0A9P8PGG3_9ASCO|nr:hypothetical protein WICMUC_004704 [Wickerhamomyces mucosus]
MSSTQLEDAIANDASYYIPGGLIAGVKAIDVPMKGTNPSDAPEIVTIDFEEEMPDHTDLIGFLDNENPDVKYWIAIACAFSEKNIPDAPFEIIDSALARYPSGEANLALHNARAWLLIRQAKRVKDIKSVDDSFRLAATSISHVINKDRTNSIAELALAEISYQKSDYDNALSIYDRIIRHEHDKKLEDEKSDIEVYASLGRAKILFKRKSYQASLRQFQAVLILKPITKPDSRIGIGLNFWRLKDKALAINSWERALEIDPKNDTAKLLLTLAKFDSSFNSLSDDEFIAKYSAALDSLNGLLNENSNDSVSLLLLASYYYSKGEYDSVLKIAERVLSTIKLSSNIRSDANFWIARVNYQRGDFVTAQKFFTESLRSNQENLLAKLGVGQSQFQREQIEDSIITFENILKENEKTLEVNYILGILYSLKNDQRGIKLLEKYVRLSTEKNEPIILNSYLTLSQQYENKDINQALGYLSKALESLKSSETLDIPIEILNNLGVFHFIKGNPQSAQLFFESARKSNKSQELEVTLLFNEARSLESQDQEKSTELYNLSLEKSQSYIYSKIRLLYLELLKVDIKDDNEVSAKIEGLVSTNPSNLEVRAFYSWYLKAAKKTINEKGENLESKHNKETLVTYDSHDNYALISLGNLYCSIAREIKGKSPQDIEKRNQSYVRGATLFQKVLSLDPNNVFAAQGIAIIFVENKLSNIALETFRKIRDSIDDISVYINLGHCLLEVGQYAKAIENYEIALSRYGDDTKDSRYLTLVARAWFARAVAEKSLESYYKSLEFSQKSYDVGVANGYYKLIPSLKYNIAFVKFNIAQFVSKLDLSKRTVDDIIKSLESLKEAIVEFNELTEEKYPPINVEVLKQRASMGSNTLVNQLERSLKEQEAYELKYQSKIEEAKRLRELEKQRQELEEEKRRAEEETKENEKKELNKKLQEQALQWEKEREEINQRFEEEEKSRKTKRKDAILTDEEFSGAEDDRPVRKTKKSNGKRSKRKKGSNFPNDDEEEGEVELKKRKTNKKYKSADVIVDSDEELEDFDESKLGNDEDDDDELEKAENNIQENENNDDEDEDGDLF